MPLAPAPDEVASTKFVAPDLRDTSVLIVAETEIEASLLARRLGRWGAKTCAVVDERIAFALLPERHWDALLVDHPLVANMIATADLARLDVPRRIALITPAERHELPALKAAGFTGYLVKPVRAASLAARLTTEHVFDHAAAGAADAEAAAGADKPAKSKGLSILVAEDNEINALLMRSLLTRLGHRPPSPATAKRRSNPGQPRAPRCTPYDLVLMDVQMPVMDGLEAARRIRAAEAENNAPRTRILALTANAHERRPRRRHGRRHGRLAGQAARPRAAARGA